MTAGIVVAASSCTPEPVTGPVPTIEGATFAAALNVNLANMTKMANGVYFQDIPAGNGTVAAVGNHLTVHYTGYYTNGTSFDTSIGKTPFGFTIGASPAQVIKGWDEGLVGMKVGGTRKLVIPPAMGYGGGSFNGIPPNSILVFNVQLVSIP
jgi:FKBP-type peptidyl-prolyl cis-trans isomerase FkpA